MRPWWPNLYLQGEASRLPRPGFTVEPAGPAEAAALEERWSGVDRLADARHWAARSGGSPFVVRDGGAVAAIGYAADRRREPGRVLVRLRIAPDTDPVASCLAALRWSAPEGPVTTAIGGPHPAVPIMLEAGFRIVDRDTFMASHPGLIDPELLLPDPGLL
jgi:hypothetical protein